MTAPFLFAVRICFSVNLLVAVPVVDLSESDVQDSNIGTHWYRVPLTKEHEKLYEIISDKGCILSEYPLGTPPRAYSFPKRNRLIAALSDRLYVINAGWHSGTTSTIESGKKYGREVIIMTESFVEEKIGISRT